MGLDFYLYTTLDGNRVDIFHGCITHNLRGMANKAGVADVLWTPQNTCAIMAMDIKDTLAKGLEELKTYPNVYNLLNPPVGTYEDLVRFVEEVLRVCIRYPSARIEAEI